jgi:hypothetical protein
LCVESSNVPLVRREGRDLLDSCGHYETWGKASPGKGRVRSQWLKDTNETIAILTTFLLSESLSLLSFSTSSQVVEKGKATACLCRYPPGRGISDFTDHFRVSGPGTVGQDRSGCVPTVLLV